jgi:hypothetical protein
MELEYRIKIIEEGVITLDADRNRKNVAEELAMRLVPALIQIPTHRLPSGVSVTLEGEEFVFSWELLEAMHYEDKEDEDEGQ